MQIIVGSKNPVKVKAVEEAFQKYWPGCEVVGVEVSSGVAEQPMSEEETRRGARSRAKIALKRVKGADYGVGLEGGVTEFEGKMYECAWACVIKTVEAPPRPLRVSRHFSGRLRRSDVQGLGGGLYFELPEEVAERIRAGGELGPIMDEMTKEKNVKQKSGAIGIFSKGQLDRKTAYVNLVLQALIKFVSPEWYG